MSSGEDDTYYIPVFDAAAVAAVLFSFVAYLAIYQSRARSRTGSLATQTGRNFLNMARWVEKHNRLPDAPSVTLVVQSTRNTILVGIFVGGSSLTAAISATDMLARPGGLTPQLVVRQLIIAGMLFISFLNWAQVIRFANHIGYYCGTLESHIADKKAKLLSEKMEPGALVNPGMESEIRQVGAGLIEPPKLTAEEVRICQDTAAMEEVKIYAQKMAEHFSLGFRFIFFGIPFWLYAAGPVALVAGGGGTLIFLVMFDFPRSSIKED